MSSEHKNSEKVVVDIGYNKEDYETSSDTDGNDTETNTDSQIKCGKLVTQFIGKLIKFIFLSVVGTGLIIILLSFVSGLLVGLPYYLFVEGYYFLFSFLLFFYICGIPGLLLCIHMQ